MLKIGMTINSTMKKIVKHRMKIVPVMEMQKYVKTGTWERKLKAYFDLGCKETQPLQFGHYCYEH